MPNCLVTGFHYADDNTLVLSTESDAQAKAVVDAITAARLPVLAARVHGGTEVEVVSAQGLVYGFDAMPKLARALFGDNTELLQQVQHTHPPLFGGMASHGDQIHLQLYRDARFEVQHNAAEAANYLQSIGVTSADIDVGKNGEQYVAVSRKELMAALSYHEDGMVQAYRVAALTGRELLTTFFTNELDAPALADLGEPMLSIRHRQNKAMLGLADNMPERLFGDQDEGQRNRDFMLDRLYNLNMPAYMHDAHNKSGGPSATFEVDASQLNRYLNEVDAGVYGRFAPPLAFDEGDVKRFRDGYTAQGADKGNQKGGWAGGRG